MAIASKITIEVKIRDIEKLEETAKKCCAVTKAHPWLRIAIGKPTVSNVSGFSPA